MAWKISEVMRRTGLTARTLHFYEQKGLIGPVARNLSGHRIYKSSDLARLQQIKTLRLLGIALSDMVPYLEQSQCSVAQLKQQISRLKQQRQALARVEDRLQLLVDMLESRSDSFDGLDDMLFQTLESITMYENYFNPTEIDQMHNKKHDESSDQTQAQAWQLWVEQLEAARVAGQSADSEPVRQLMAHWQQMLEQLSYHDQTRAKAFNDLLHNEPEARKAHGISDALFAFMAEASKGH